MEVHQYTVNDRKNTILGRSACTYFKRILGNACDYKIEIIHTYYTLYSIINAMESSKIPGPACSKLTTSLVNVSLLFQTLISQICQYICRKNVRSFCTAKAFLIFFNKKFQWFWLKSRKTLNELTSKRAR